MTLNQEMEMNIMGMGRDLNPVLSGARKKSLASVVANLINENEPLLRASADGVLVEVEERGGGAVMLITVSEILPARNAA